MGRKLWYGWLFAGLVFGVLPAAAETEPPPPLPTGVILDTDIGSSMDDLVALAALRRMESDGRVKLLGVMLNRPTEATDTTDRYRVFMAAYLHAETNAWDDVPIGTIAPLPPGVAEYRVFVPYWKLSFPCEEWAEPILPPPASRGGAVTNAVTLYRQLLAAAPDHSVEIVAIGFFTNLAKLLDSPSDAISPKGGRELVAEKVRKLRLMAGCFNESVRHADYNISHDIASAEHVFRDWPGAIAVFPSEIGVWVYLSRRAIMRALEARGEHPPMAKVYEHFEPDEVCGRKSQLMWDACPVLEMCVPGLFTGEGPGEVEVYTADGESGLTRYRLSPHGRVTLYHLSKLQAQHARNHLLNILGDPSVDSKASPLRLVTVRASAAGGCVRIENASSDAVSLAGVQFCCHSHESGLAVRYAFPSNAVLKAHETRVLDGGELWPGQRVPEGCVHAMLWGDDWNLLFDDFFNANGLPETDF